MTAHDCTTHDPACFRCDLSQTEVEDPFTTAARAEAEERWPRVARRNKTAEEWLDEGMASGFVLGAQWHAAQEPTEDDAYAAQVETKRHQPDYVKPGVIRCHCGAPGFWSTSDAHTQHALWHALRAAARRDEEKRDG